MSRTATWTKVGFHPTFLVNEAVKQNKNESTNMIDSSPYSPKIAFAGFLIGFWKVHVDGLPVGRVQSDASQTATSADQFLLIDRTRSSFFVHN